MNRPPRLEHHLTQHVGRDATRRPWIDVYPGVGVVRRCGRCHEELPLSPEITREAITDFELLHSLC